MSSTPPRRPRRSLALDAALVGLLSLGLVGIVGVLLVRYVVLEPDTYTSALVRADAYERTYTEVLADPELADLVEDLIGGLDVDPGLAADARIVGTNALRWTLPPSQLERGSEALITAVLAHIRGDADVLDADVDIEAVLDRIPSTGVTEARALLAYAESQLTTTPDEYRIAIEEFVAALAAGEVPDAVPELDVGGLASGEVVDLILDGLGLEPDDPARARVTASVLAGAERDLLITIGSAQVQDHADEVVLRLRDAAEDRHELDVVDAVRTRTDRTRAEVVDTLDGAAGVARWFGPVTAGAAALVTAVAVAGLIVTNRGGSARVWRLVAIGSAIAGSAVLVSWWGIARVLADPLDRATGPAPAGWGFPAGLRALLVDVRSEIADQLAGWAVRAGGILVGVAVVLVLFGWASAPRQRDGSRASRRRWLVGPAALVAALAGGVLLVATAPGDANRCNGHEELCERPYDEVVQAATHNSMSSPDVVTIWPEHDGDLRAQLDAGVRALLIDTHYWTPLVSADQITGGDSKIPVSLAEQVVRLAGPLAAARPGTFLCHNHCALGAAPFLDGMRQVREFLDDSPGDVVTLIIQDAVTPEDTAAVVRAAGLEPFLHTHEPGDAWPTLGEMIDRGERLVVFAEAEGPPPRWYGNAFDSMRETPYLFLEPDDFSCEANRGGEDASLFLMNHWVTRTAPDRVDSVRVNTFDALVERSRECAEVRGDLPNFLAVNFYDIGELMRAVDTLNGVN
jgi:hypothetical protein